jgi:hypothetical protein
LDTTETPLVILIKNTTKPKTNKKYLLALVVDEASVSRAVFRRRF